MPHNDRVDLLGALELLDLQVLASALSLAAKRIL